MKKLMIALSAAAMAFGLKAADAGYISGTSFEDDATGTYSAASPLWKTVDDANRTLTVTAEQTSPASVPAEYATASHEKYLAVKTTLTKPIEMNVVKESAATSQTIGTGVYFDSLVKFTVCDEAPDTTSYTDAKIMVWLQENSDGTATNFYVRAGQYAGSAWTTADYKCSTITSFDVDAFHRLTIKAIKDIYEASSEDNYAPGFVVFVDGTALERSSDAPAMGLVEANLNGSASEFYIAGNLFASMVQTTGLSAKNTISAVGFAGQGALDDLAITTNAPSFAVDKEARIASVGSTVCYSVSDINTAIAAATADSTITILRSITELTDLILTGSKNFTLDLNGKTISGGINGSNTPMYAGTLTIDDSVGTGKVDGTLAAGDNFIVLNAGKYLKSANTGIAWAAVAKTYYAITENGDYYEITENENGTTAKPWLINTAADFTSKFKNLPTDAAHQNFKLTANINFANAVFNGIGTDEAPFKGVFDGDGKTISNYRLPATGKYEGFFMVSTNATIKNVTFTLAATPFDTPAAEVEEFGGAAVAGRAHGAAKFINVTANGTITGGVITDNLPNHTIAGIAVQTTGAAEFTDCTNNVNIVSAQNNKTAGFVAIPSTNAANTANIALKFTRCVNNGNIALGSDETTDGGTAAFTGWTKGYDITFTDCANKGAISSTNTTQLGSFCGKLYKTCSATIVGTCTTTATNIPAIGTTDLQPTEAPNFNFATVDAEGVATFPATPAAGGTYKVMLAKAAADVLLALDETIAFDRGVVAGTITVTPADATANKITSNTVGTVTTYTCVAKTAITAVTLAAATVEFGTADAPAATVKAGEETVDPANYELSYTPEYSAETAAGTEITVTATAKGDDYTGTASATFTVVAKTVAPEITFSTADIVEWTDGLEFPTVTVGDYVENTDYTKAWSDEIDEPEAGATNTYTVTVTMKGNYTGSNTKEFKVWKAAGTVEPIKPGTDGEVTITPTGDAAADLAAAQTEADKLTIEAADDNAAAAGQSAVLKSVVTATDVPGKYTVSVEINTNAAAYNAPEKAVETVADNLSTIAAATPDAEGNVEVQVPAANVTPGLYYSVDVATELGSSDGFTEGDRVLATSAGVTLKAKKPTTGNAAFFKVSEHMTSTPSNKE